MKGNYFTLLFFFIGTSIILGQDLENPTLGKQKGPNGIVNVTAFQSDGKILIAGEFTSFDGTPVGRIVRLNSDGSLDNSFNSAIGANGKIHVIVIQPDEKILIGGEFTSYDDISQNYLSRINPDGSLDTSFDIGSGLNNTVYTISLFSDGKILVGGDFSLFNGEANPKLIRLESNGILDSSFLFETGPNNSVLASAIQSDGRALVGGNFSSFDGLTSNRIIRINSNGTVDNSFEIGEGFDNRVEAIAILLNGKILVGGDFQFFNGAKANRIIRLNQDGSIDSTFNTGTGANEVIRNILIEGDGKILIEGAFSVFNGVGKQYLVKLNPDGSIDSTF